MNPNQPIDENVLKIEGRAVAEDTFDTCVRAALRDLFTNTGITPNSIAAETSLDASYIRKVMRGEQTIGLFTLFKIASVAKVDAADFVATIDEKLKEEVRKERSK